MPEGHTIHRLARQHRADLAGRPVRARSPQGRFTEGARRLDGAVLEAVEAYGKHLFYRFDRPAVLHVHLGLVGTFRTSYGRPPESAGAVRLRLEGGDATVDLAGPMVCEILAPGEEDAIIAPLGPDPLRPRADAGVFARRLRSRKVAVGAALLDQTVIAGVGNVFRAEALFLCGLHPDIPASELSDPDVDCLWSVLRVQLRAGVRAGRIVTVVPAEVGVRRAADVPENARVYVYRRGGQACRRCGESVTSWTLAQRPISACPRCQPRR